jgi:hypothetical protein
VSDILDVRDWVGSNPDDPTINAQLARFDGQEHAVERAALAILLQREADAGPAKWSVDGDYSEDDSAGRKTLSARIARLRAIVGDDVSTLLPVTTAALDGPGNLR